MVIILLFLFFSIAVSASEKYDLDFMNNDFGMIKTSDSWIKNGIESGIHSVGISINEQQEVSMKVEFVDISGDVKPCFNENQLAILGIINPIENKRCFQVSDISKDASYTYISSKTLIILNIPDIFRIKKGKKLRTRKELWEHGINSTRINYNSYSSINTDGNIDGYLGLSANASIGEWRVKGSASLYKSNNYSSNSIGDIYAYTDIDPITSELSIGNIISSSGATVNSSIPIFGMKLELSEQMLNPDWTSYAPVIKERVNSTSAKVTILDDERVIYSKLMTTGEFEISEFDVSSVGSELKLVIEESNGVTRVKTIPYTRLPSMLKEDSYTYNLALGQYRGEASDLTPAILSGQINYGFGFITSEISTLLSNDYMYAELDNTVDIRNMGAFSLGVGLSNSNEYMGHIIRLSYAKFLKDTNTSLQFASTQYRSSEFRTFTDSLYDGENPNYSHIKNSVDISINQKIYDSSLYFGYKLDKYHNNKSPTKSSFYSSINMNVKDVVLGFSLSRDNYNNRNGSEIEYGLNISFPLDKTNNLRVTDYLSGNNYGDLNNNLVLTRSSDNTDYSLSLSSSINDSDINHSASGSVLEKTSFGDIGVRADLNQEQSKASVTANGGVLIYDRGILFTPHLGISSAIVDFGKGASDITLNFDERNITNSNGIGVIPNSRPYIKNEILMDITESYNVEINNMPRFYVPRKGSTSIINIDSSVGIRKLIKIENKYNFFGEPLYNLKTNKRVAFVGIDNIVYISGLKDVGKEYFYIGKNNQCKIEIDMNKVSNVLNEVVYVKCSEK